MISRCFRSGAPATPIWGKRFPELLGIAAHYRRMDICVGTQDDMCEPWSSQWFSEGLLVARPPTSKVRCNNIRDLFQSLSMCLKDPSCAVAREYSVNKKTGRKLRRVTQLLKEQDSNTSQYYTLKTGERICSKFKGLIFQQVEPPPRQHHRSCLRLSQVRCSSPHQTHLLHLHFPAVERNVVPGLWLPLKQGFCPGNVRPTLLWIVARQRQVDDLTWPK